MKKLKFKIINKETGKTVRNKNFRVLIYPDGTYGLIEVIDGYYGDLDKISYESDDEFTIEWEYSQK